MHSREVNVCFNRSGCYQVTKAVYFSTEDVGEASYSKHTCWTAQHTDGTGEEERN